MTASIDFRHPSYLFRLPDWTVLAHTYEGERCVKNAGVTYLPATAGMIANGFGQNTRTDNLGQKAYDAYRTRAVYHPFVQEAVDGLVGMMHRKPPKIEVPKALEPMVESASIAGEHLCQVWRRVSEAQLLYGRCGMLVDIPSGVEINKAVPYFAFYPAMTILNWDPGVRDQGRQVLELVVLDESGYVRVDDARWEFRHQYRVLILSSAATSLNETDQEAPGKGTYLVGVQQESVGGDPGAPPSLDIAKVEFKAPSLGGRSLDAIPFVFVNSNDLVPEPCIPPLLGLANLSLAIYRGEADYRQTLFMQGQATLVRTGATDDQQKSMTGAGAILDVPMGGDAKYIGVESNGLTEQREALENDKAKAGDYSTRMLNRESGDAESGEALRVRVQSRTANLTRLQMTAAQAFKDGLKHAGKWMGLSDAELEKIVVEPNLDFTDDTPTTADLDVLMSAKQKGLPLSLESIHTYLKGHEFTTMEYEEEIKVIEEEQTTLGMNGQAESDLDPYAEDETQLDENGEPVDAPPAGGNGNGKNPPPFGKKKSKPPAKEKAS